MIDALATLAFDYPPRASYFRGELEQFLLLAREEALDPLAPLGSYAGAMGVPAVHAVQLPQLRRRRRRRRPARPVADWDDVIASVANYLKLHGWRAGEPVMVAADVSDARLDGVELDKLELDRDGRLAARARRALRHRPARGGAARC